MKKTHKGDNREMDADRTVKLTWPDTSEADLRAALASVKGGFDASASMKLIKYFYARIHDNLPYDQTILLEYLEHAFGKIVDGVQPNHAFGFEQRASTE
jgi:hypothetical protein